MREPAARCVFCGTADGVSEPMGFPICAICRYEVVVEQADVKRKGGLVMSKQGVVSLISGLVLALSSLARAFGADDAAAAFAGVNEDQVSQVVDLISTLAAAVWSFGAAVKVTLVAKK